MVIIENKTLKNLYHIWIKENSLIDNRKNFDFFLNFVLTFQDHWKIWLKENKEAPEKWTYEKWINEYCFKSFKEIV